LKGSLQIGSSFSDKLHHAWELRVARKIEPCRMLVSELAGLEPDSLQNAADFKVLQVSLKRSANENKVAKTLLDQIERECPLSARGFFYRYERASACFNVGEYSQALDMYLAAYHATNHPTWQAVALVNAMGCLDHLGMSFESAREELVVLLPQIECSDIRRLISNTDELLKVHLLLRNGDIPGIESMKRKRNLNDGNQISYLFAWVSELPYLRIKKSVDPTSYFGPDPGIYKGIQQFRARTLQGLTHPDDDLITNPFEFADRLYLWVWRWLISGDPSALDRFVPLFQRLIVDWPVHRLTVEDRKLMRNALLWMSLFDGEASKMQIKRVLRSVTETVAVPMPIFDFEALVIEWMSAVRDGKKSKAEDFLKCLIQDPLWKSKSTMFPNLVMSLCGEKTQLPLEWASLQNRLSDLCGLKAQKTASHLIVHLLKGEIEEVAKRKKTVSIPLTYALDLFHSQEKVSCADMLEACFGISSYDPLVHNSKIFNLLARLKTIASPQLTFHMKMGSVYCHGSWKGIRFVGVSDKDSPLAGCRQWRSLIASVRVESSAKDVPDARPSAFALKVGQTLRRHDFERVLGIPRSTANRIISGWLKQGALRRVGAGKKTVYIPTTRFESILREGNQK